MRADDTLRNYLTCRTEELWMFDESEGPGTHVTDAYHRGRLDAYQDILTMIEAYEGDEDDGNDAN